MSVGIKSHKPASKSAKSQPEDKSSGGSSPLKGMSYDQGAAQLSPGNQGYDTQAVQLKPAADAKKKPDPITGDNTYAIGGKGGTKARGIGKGAGEDDNGQPIFDDAGKPVLDESGKQLVGKPKNSEVEISNDVAKHDSSVIEKQNTLKEGESGAYTETYAGKGSKVEGPKGPEIKNGKPEMSGGKATVAIGAGIKKGRRGQVGDKEKSNASYDVHSGANAGASASAEANQDGIKGSAAASASADLINVSAQAEAKKKYTITGVTDPVETSVGVSGKARVGADVGIGISAGISKDQAGIEAKAGGFIGAEAEGELAAKLGPISVKLKASGLVGAGAEAKGALIYKDGKITISASALAAIGYGGKLGGEITIDVRQAVELGLVAAKNLHKLADADGDGKLSLNDGATHLSNAANKGADKLDKGADSFIKNTDRDGDGKLTTTDMKMMAGDAYDAASEKAGELKDKAGEMVDAGKEKAGQMYDAGKKKAGEAVDATKKAAKDAYAAVDTPEERAALIQKGKQKISKGLDDAWSATKQKTDDAAKWADEKLTQADKRLTELKNAAKDKAVDTAKAIRDYDYKGAAEDTKDMVVDTGKAVIKKGEQVIEKGRQLAEKGVEKTIETAKAAKDGVVKAYEALDTPKEREEAYEAAKAAAAKKLQQAKQAAIWAKQQAAKKAADAKAYALKKAAEAKKKAAELAAAAKKALYEAPEKTKKAVVDTYNAASKEVSKAYNTASQGLSSAKKKVSATASKVWDYVKPSW